MLRTRTFEQFNEAQRQALDHSRNLAVRAGAGSGKTSVLVERIVQLLAAPRDDEPLRLDALVALTFTRKAAGQLRDRLEEAFLALARTASDLAVAERWHGHVAELPAAMIGTIDAFCARVLRELGHLDPQSQPIEPGFEPLTAYEERMLKRQAVDQVIDRLNSLSDDVPDPEERLRAQAVRWWGEYEGFDALARHLIALLYHPVDPHIIGAAHTALQPAEERVLQLWQAQPAVRRLREGREPLRADLLRVIEAVDGIDDPGTCLQELRAGAAEVLGALSQEGREAEARALECLRAALLTNAGTPRVQGLNRVLVQVQPLQEEWQPFLERFLFDFDGEVRAREAADRLALLLEPAHEEYQRRCHAERRHDFLTLARRTRDLLRRAPPARRALQQRYRYLMVDEFQDTNQLQWDILSCLVNDEAGRLDRDRLFIVGDPQQSIYRFRHADVAVFRHVQDLVKTENARHGQVDNPTDYDRDGAVTPATAEQRLGIMPLAENYRTLPPAPLTIVDRVFAHVFDPVVHQLNTSNGFEVEYQPLLPGLADNEFGSVCYVIPRLPDEEEEDPEADEPPTEMIALPQVSMVVDRLMALHGSPRPAARAGEPATLAWADMAVLLPSRDVVLTELEREFRRRGVPFLVHKGIGFWQRLEVRDVVNLALALADPEDQLSLFAVLRGPVGQCTDEEIFFLSQLGRVRLTRGLHALASLANGDLATAPAWESLPGAVRLALSEHWQNLSDADRARLIAVARAFETWTQAVDRTGHAELLERILEETGAYAIYASEVEAEATLANLRKVLDTIRAMEDRSGCTLATLARQLSDLVDEAEKEEQAPAGPAANAVQVMTVHAAKGLEFPVVAVMKLERRAVRPTAYRLGVKRPDDPLLPEDCADLDALTPAGTVSVAVRHPRRPREVYTTRLLKALSDLDRAQALAESRRLFYVAATRARAHLILAGKQPRVAPSGKPVRLHDCWQRWLEDALGIRDEDKTRGFWEDPARGLRVTIVTAPAETSTPITSVASVAHGKPDLEAIHSPHEVRVVRADELCGRSREVRLVGALAQSILTEKSTSREWRDGDWLRDQVARMGQKQLDPADAWAQVPPDSLRVAEIADATSVLLNLLAGEATLGTRFRRLLSVNGVDAVPFRLRIGPWSVMGTFDRLLEKGDGYEALVWTDAEADDLAGLLALALARSGRAALTEGRVVVHRLRIDNGEVKGVAFTAQALADLESEWLRRLESITT